MHIWVAKTALDASSRQARITLHVAGKLITAVARSPSRLMRIADHPTGTSLCLELLKGLVFVLITGGLYYWVASRLLRRIAVQRQHLAMIFQGVSDCLFLVGVEAGGYRFICVNNSFLKVTGLTREQEEGKRIEE